MGGADPVIGGRSDHGKPIGQAIFEIVANFEFLVRRNRNEIAMRVESKRRLGKGSVCDKLSIT